MNAVLLDEAIAFVAANPHVFLLARRSDGYPTGYAMMATARPADRVIEFSTYRASAKVKNLVREGAGSVLAVADGPDGRRMLLAEGTVSLAEGPRHLGDPRAGAGATGEVPAEILSTVARSHESGKRVVLELHLTRARFVTGEMASR